MRRVGNPILIFVSGLSFSKGPLSLKASGGEFGWGGTSAIRKRRCPKGSSMRTEISC